MLLTLTSTGIREAHHNSKSEQPNRPYALCTLPCICTACDTSKQPNTLQQAFRCMSHHPCTHMYNPHAYTSIPTPCINPHQTLNHSQNAAFLSNPSAFLRNPSAFLSNQALRPARDLRSSTQATQLIKSAFNVVPAPYKAPCLPTIQPHAVHSMACHSVHDIYPPSIHQTQPLWRLHSPVLYNFLHCRMLLPLQQCRCLHMAGHAILLLCWRAGSGSRHMLNDDMRPLFIALLIIH